MSHRIEMHLYHGLSATGRLQISETSLSGPWVDLWLPSSMPITEALSTWQDMANNHASLTRTYAFSWFGPPQNKVVLFASGGDAWAHVEFTLADFLGVGKGPIDISSTHPNTDAYGIIDFTGRGSVGWMPPAHKSVGEVYEYRGGRLDSYHHSRREEVEIEILAGEEDDFADLLEQSPLLRQGRCRVACGDTDNPFSATNPGGYIDVDPLHDGIHIDRIEGGRGDVVIRTKSQLVVG